MTKQKNKFIKPKKKKEIIEEEEPKFQIINEPSNPYDIFVEWCKINIPIDQPKIKVDLDNSVLIDFLKKTKVVEIKEVYVQTFGKDSTQIYVHEPHTFCVNLGVEELYEWIATRPNSAGVDSKIAKINRLLQQNKVMYFLQDKDIIYVKQDKVEEKKINFRRPNNYFRVFVMIKTDDYSQLVFSKYKSLANRATNQDTEEFLSWF